MQKSSFKNFKQFELSQSETQNTKGSGIFCEIYIGYTDLNKRPIENDIMEMGMHLDWIMDNYGLAAALQQGGNDYMASYGY